QFTNHDAIAVCIPHATYWNNEGVGAQGEHGDRARSTGKMTKERDKDPVALQCIYVGQKAEVTAAVKDGEAFQNRIALVNGTVAEAAADPRGITLEQRIVHRASEVGDGLADCGRSKGVYLPVAKVWLAEDHAPSARPGSSLSCSQYLRER